MNKRKKRVIQVLFTVVLIALGAFGMIKLTESKPEMKKRKMAAPLPMVRTMVVQTASKAMTVEGEGTVRPLKEIDLAPQVSGKVVFLSPSMISGGAFKKGETLLRIEPEDYRLAVVLQESKVKNSQSLLRQAEEETEAAKEEWRQLYMDDGKEAKDPTPLVLKQPQLAAAQAKVAADKADLKNAHLALERTVIKAPFSGRVEVENVGLGQYVRAGEKLATLYSTDVVEIVVPLEDETLFWFHVPGFTPGDGPGAEATIRARFAGRDCTWKGRVVRAEGKMDERTRMVRVVVRVEKPYATKPPLAVGLFVRVEIKGRHMPNLAILPRGALHQGDTVWVVDQDDRIQFRKVQVARIEGEQVQVEGGLKNGERVAISPLKTVTDGMTVRPVSRKEGQQG